MAKSLSREHGVSWRSVRCKVGGAGRRLVSVRAHLYLHMCPSQEPSRDVCVMQDMFVASRDHLTCVRVGLCVSPRSDSSCSKAFLSRHDPMRGELIHASPPSRRTFASSSLLHAHTQASQCKPHRMSAPCLPCVIFDRREHILTGSVHRRSKRRALAPPPRPCPAREASSASSERMEPNGMEAARASHLDWLASEWVAFHHHRRRSRSARHQPSGDGRGGSGSAEAAAMDMVLFSSEVAPDADEDAVSQVTSTHAEHVIDPDGNDDFGASSTDHCPLHLPATTDSVSPPVSLRDGEDSESDTIRLRANAHHYPTAARICPYR